jgi:hypothetical protein
MAMEVTDHFVDLVTRAHEYLTARQDVLRSEYHLDRWPRWDWDQGTGQLVFSEEGVARLVADIQFVGSVSNQSKTWLWAWANPHLTPPVKRDVDEVRRFGEAHGIPQLTTAKWVADEIDGWEMTSIAAYVLQAKGAYRTPRDDGGFTYLIFTDVRWAPDGTPQ